MTTCMPTQLETIFSRAAGRSVRAGDVVEVPVDLVMAHDATMALVLQDFERLSCTVWDPNRLMVVCDHFCPPARSDWADLQKSVLRFTERHQLPNLRLYQGICHQLLLEDLRVQPGCVVVGADSHTTLIGAVGCFATGLGATDILGCLATGRTWFRVPESVRVEIIGRRKPWVMGRDIAFHLLRHFGESGANYRALELHDLTDDGLAMDSRAAICCMAPEMGAKNALFVSDGITHDYLQKRDHGVTTHFPTPKEGARYTEALTVDTSVLTSLVALPHSPAKAVPVAEAGEVRIDEIYIGSCAGGRLEDFAMAAALLAGKRIVRGVKVIAVPSSVTVQREAMARGYIDALLEAGVCVSNPSCGACGGIDKGVLATGDVALTTSTRNFQGRMGPRDTQVYLASTATCAASALTGCLTPPEEMWS